MRFVVEIIAKIKAKIEMLLGVKAIQTTKYVNVVHVIDNKISL